ncbi:MAG: hypothetical protein ACE5E5_16035 [Phycisphaerae bacterium]
MDSTALYDAVATQDTVTLIRSAIRGLLRVLSPALAAVVGQDLDKADDGAYRIAKRVATDRVISTVDPEARHGHKTSARSFDGYKGHISIDPDSEVMERRTSSNSSLSWRLHRADQAPQGARLCWHRVV